jgi:RimJ/RimL family protein N-acetyltransferase
MQRRFDRIRTDRLIMRRWQDGDRPLFAAMNADLEVMRYFPARYSRAESDASVDRIEQHFTDRGYGLWALEVAGSGQFIGFTGLAPMPPGTPGEGGLEIGWRLMASAWHRGYATEAARAAADVAFSGLGLPELWSVTAVVNEPSIAVMQRLGMTEHSRFEHPKVPDGHPVRPHVAYWMAAPGAGTAAGGDG